MGDRENGSGDQEGIGLDEAIEALRVDLEAARSRAGKVEVRLPITSMTVELQAVVTKSADGKAGFKIPVIDLELGVGGSWSRESTQTVTIVFGPPVDRGGETFPVAEPSDKKPR